MNDTTTNHPHEQARLWFALFFTVTAVLSCGTPRATAADLPDAGEPTSDGGGRTPDAGVPQYDAGILDGGGTAPDAGVPQPDAGILDDGGNTTDAGEPQPDAGILDGGDTTPDAGPDAGVAPGDPFADRVVSFTPGPNAGFGQKRFPEVVLGPPHGGGNSSGSLDVLSLGKGGCIVLEFTDIEAVDGEGTDFLVFENPFGTYYEPAIVSASADGKTWHEFPCDTKAKKFPGCAGTHWVFSSPDNGISATDPAVAGGDPFDLREVGLATARFIRVCDAAVQFYAGIAGGFDLDGVAVVNGKPISP